MRTRRFSLNTGSHARNVAIAAGVFVGCLVTLGTFGVSGFALTAHTICVRGDVASEGTLWTPYVLLNAPYLGWANYSSKFFLFEQLGPTNVTAGGFLGNGNLSTGYIETQRWTLFSQTNQTELGPGFNRPCESPYVAENSKPSEDISTQGLPLEGPGNTSNSGEPTTYSGLGFEGVTFANGFSDSNRPSITTCGKPARSLTFNSSSFDVSITIQASHGPIPFAFSISSLENFTYDFPANAGTWQVDDTQLNVGLRGPGLAFSWAPC